MPRARKIDDNHRDVKRALLSVPGVTVADTSGAGNGFPDLVVGFRGVSYLLEVKDGNKPPSRQKLTPLQKGFHTIWTGQVCVVTSPDEALEAIGVG